MTGCISADDASLHAGASTKSITAVNKLTANKLTANKLTANKLTANKLTANSLADGTLLFNSAAGDGIETTEDGREVIQYMTTCALTEEDVLTVTHDDVTYSYPGLLGLAPEWKARSLTELEKERISACLFAHVNAYGVSLQISARSAGFLYASPSERDVFRVYEGTFFGMSFVDENEAIQWYSCQGDDQEVALAQSTERALRVCADPLSECAIESLGRCRDICETYTPGYGWNGCWAGDTRYDQAISTYLMPDLADVMTCGSGQSCTAANALASAASVPAILDCSDALSCEASCGSGGLCTIDGTQAAALVATVEADAVADINCHQAGACAAECGAGSRCEMACGGGAACLLLCTDAEDCGFSLCPGGAVTCGDGIVACNRACP